MEAQIAEVKQQLDAANITKVGPILFLLFLIFLLYEVL
jgi:hypothetical protein